MIVNNLTLILREKETEKERERVTERNRSKSYFFLSIEDSEGFLKDLVLTGLWTCSWEPLILLPSGSIS